MTEVRKHEHLASTQTVSLGSAVERNRSSSSLSLALPRDQLLQPLRWGELVPGVGAGLGIRDQCKALTVPLPPWQHTEALLYGFQSIAETIDVNYSDVVPGLIGLIPRISISNVQLADTVMFTIGEWAGLGWAGKAPLRPHPPSNTSGEKQSWASQNARARTCGAVLQSDPICVCRIPV